MGEKQIMEESLKEEIIELSVIKRFDIPGMPKPNPLHSLDASQRIISHLTQSYDEHGNVIVISGEKEDLEKSIGQYKDQVGPKNIIRMIEAGADPSTLIHNDRLISGDFVDMDFKSVNEASDAVKNACAKANESLEKFNKQFGTTLDEKTYLDLVSKGLLEAHVNGIKKEGESSNEEK